jgi:ABC-type nickel/cobalt efflux system permease component RcnA
MIGFYAFLCYKVTRIQLVLSHWVITMSNETSPEKSPWGWKALIIAFILSAFFLGFFYLAVTNEPDYMPSQQNKHNTQQHAFKNAPAMSEEALAKAKADKEVRMAHAHSEASAVTITESHGNDHSHEAGESHGHGH